MRPYTQPNTVPAINARPVRHNQPFNVWRDAVSYRSKCLRLVTLMATSVIVAGCHQMKVSDLGSWCSHVYNVAADRADYSAFSIDRAAVQRSIVERWNRVLLENAAQTLGVPVDSIQSDSVMVQLRKTGIVGAWSAGDTLDFALTPFPPPIILSGEPPARVFAREYAERMKRMRDRQPEPGDADPMGYCLVSGIDYFFARLVIHHANEAGQPDTASVRTIVFHKLQDAT